MSHSIRSIAIALASVAGSLAGCSSSTNIPSSSFSSQNAGVLAFERKSAVLTALPFGAVRSHLLVAERLNPGDVKFYDTSNFEAPISIIDDLAGPEGAAVSVDPFAHLTYATETDAGDVKVYSKSGNTSALVATIGGLQSPSGVATDGLACRVYVTAYGGVHVYDISRSGYTPNVTLSASVGITVPGGLAVDVYRHRLYVAQGIGNVVVFDTGNLTQPLAKITGLDSPGGVAVDVPHSRIYVTENSVGDVKAYDTTADRYAFVGTIATGLRTPFGDAYDATTGKLFVNEFSSGDVKVIDLVHQGAVETVTGLHSPWAVAVDSQPLPSSRLTSPLNEICPSQANIL